ncbi:MAG: hypothetical protein HYZ42_14880, partial [Bacteroidetes bacterium]|nr:hypothetical protein [Bacteroidota bacterium]
MRSRFTVIFFLIILVFASCDNEAKENRSEVIENSNANIQWLQNHHPSDSIYSSTLDSTFKKFGNEAYKYPELVIEAIRWGFFNIKLNKYDRQAFVQDSLLLINKSKLSKNHHAILTEQVGMMYLFLGSYDLATKQFEEAMSISSGKDRDDSILIFCNIGLGTCNLKTLEFEKAVKYYNTARQLAIQINDTASRVRVDANLGTSYLTMKEYKKAILSFNSVLPFFQLKKDRSSELICLCNLTSCYFELGDTANALIYGAKGCEYLEFVGPNPYLAYMMHSLYGRALHLNKQYNEAMKEYEVGISYAKQLNFEYPIQKNHILIASSLIEQKQETKAVEYLKMTEPYALTDPTKVLITDVYKLYGDAYAHLGNYKEAFSYNLKYHQLYDSIDLNEKKMKVEELEKKLASSEKNHIIEIQTQKITNLEYQKYYWTAAVVLLIISAIMAILLILNYRKRKYNERENILKEQLSKDILTAIEEERAFFARELHDGIAPELLILKSNLQSAPDKVFSDKVHHILEEIRNLSNKLYPTHLMAAGLTDSIIGLIERMDQENELFFSYKLDEECNNKLDSKAKLHIYRIVQEALQNVLKHANA